MGFTTLPRKLLQWNSFINKILMLKIKQFQLISGPIDAPKGIVLSKIYNKFPWYDNKSQIWPTDCCHTKLEMRDSLDSNEPKIRFLW